MELKYSLIDGRPYVALQGKGWFYSGLFRLSFIPYFTVSVGELA